MSFTGSPQVGWSLKAKAGKKRVVLELGGNAAVVVEDVGSAEGLDQIVDKVIFGAFYQSGQSCISVQRLYVKQDHYEILRSRLVSKVSELKKGDPKDENVFVGPLISESEAKRVESWVNEATEMGATILTGGTRAGTLYDATILENCPREAKVYAEEVFGPVLLVEPYESFTDAISRANDSQFGLQAGIFTTDINKAFYAFNNLEVGGVVINHVPSLRVDAQPYGGVKESGCGREGLRYAMKDMMEEKAMVMVGIGEM